VLLELGGPDEFTQEQPRAPTLDDLLAPGEDQDDGRRPGPTTLDDLKQRRSPKMKQTLLERSCSWQRANTRIPSTKRVVDTMGSCSRNHLGDIEPKRGSRPDCHNQQFTLGTRHCEPQLFERRQLRVSHVPREFGDKGIKAPLKTRISCSSLQKAPLHAKELGQSHAGGSKSFGRLDTALKLGPDTCIILQGKTRILFAAQGVLRLDEMFTIEISEGAFPLQAVPRDPLHPSPLLDLEGVDAELMPAEDA